MPAQQKCYVACKGLIVIEDLEGVQEDCFDDSGLPACVCNVAA